MLEVLRDVLGRYPPSSSPRSVSIMTPALIGCAHGAAGAVIDVRPTIVPSTDDPVPYGDLNRSV